MGKIVKRLFFGMALVVTVLVVALIMIRFSKLGIEPAYEPIEKLEIGEIELSKTAREKLNKYGKKTGDAYKIKNTFISKKVKNNIEEYVKNTSLEVAYDKNFIFISNIGDVVGEDEYAKAVLSEEQIKNGKEIYKGEINKILEVLDLQDLYNIDNLSVKGANPVSFKDKEGNMHKNQYLEIAFSKDTTFDSNYEIEGHPPYISIALNKEGKLMSMSYKGYDAKKINKEYEFKTIDEVIDDIKSENNVTVDFVYGDETEEPIEDWEDVTIENVEVVMDYPLYTYDYKYIVPYYVLTGYNKINDEITITMPAIKNKYLYVTGGVKEDLKTFAKKILGRE